MSTKHSRKNPLKMVGGANPKWGCSMVNLRVGLNLRVGSVERGVEWSGGERGGRGGCLQELLAYKRMWEARGKGSVRYVGHP